MTYLKFIAAIFFSGFAALSQAQDWFKIEVIVFENKDPSSLSHEYWAPIDAIPERSARVLKAVNEANIQSYQLLAGAYLDLHQERKLLNNSGDFRVLMHQAWMQPVATTQKPRPIAIRAGEILDNGMYELEGYIGVGRGRYLHFRPDLFFSKRLSKDEEARLLSFAEKTENAATTQPALPDLSSSAAQTTVSSAAPSFELELPEILTVHLNQAKRMRSKEVHYIDHPLFGIVVLITAVE